MPQTQEAIAHAKAAEVPVVVALNKIDLPNVNHQQDLRRALAAGPDPRGVRRRHAGREDLDPHRPGIPDLLETLGIIAELHELKANPDPPGHRHLPGGVDLRGARRRGDGPGPGRHPARRRRDGLRRRLRPRPRPVRRPGPLGPGGRPVHPGRGLGPGRGTRPPARSSPSSTTSRTPARSPRPAATAPEAASLGDPPGAHAGEPLHEDGRAEGQEPQPDPQGRRPGLAGGARPRSWRSWRTPRSRSASC